MSKQGTLITVVESQEGASPRLVTETEGFPVSVLDAPDRVNEQLLATKENTFLLRDILEQSKIQTELLRIAFNIDLREEDLP